MYVKQWYTQLLSCFVSLTGSMARLCGGDTIINVNVANGSTKHIWCRLAGDKSMKVQGETGGGLGVHGIGVKAHKTARFKNVVGATRGYSQIQSGNTLEFGTSTSSNSVYLTVIKEPGFTICKNHEISKSRNYIINNRGALMNAKKKEKWIDTTGHNHVISNDDIDESDSDSEDRYYEDFRPQRHFSKKNTW